MGASPKKQLCCNETNRQTLYPSFRQSYFEVNEELETILLKYEESHNQETLFKYFISLIKGVFYSSNSVKEIHYNKTQVIELSQGYKELLSLIEQQKDIAKMQYISIQQRWLNNYRDKLKQKTAFKKCESANPNSWYGTTHSTKDSLLHCQTVNMTGILSENEISYQQSLDDKEMIQSLKEFIIDDITNNNQLINTIILKFQKLFFNKYPFLKKINQGNERYADDLNNFINSITYKKSVMKNEAFDSIKMILQKIVIQVMIYHYYQILKKDATYQSYEQIEQFLYSISQELIFGQKYQLYDGVFYLLKHLFKESKDLYNADCQFQSSVAYKDSMKSIIIMISNYIDQFSGYDNQVSNIVAKIYRKSQQDLHSANTLPDIGQTKIRAQSNYFDNVYNLNIQNIDLESEESEWATFRKTILNLFQKPLQFLQKIEEKRSVIEKLQIIKELENLLWKELFLNQLNEVKRKKFLQNSIQLDNLIEIFQLALLLYKDTQIINEIEFVKIFSNEYIQEQSEFSFVFTNFKVALFYLLQNSQKSQTCQTILESSQSVNSEILYQ